MLSREHTVNDVVKQVPNLGLVIDLTNTNKYYNGEVSRSPEETLPKLILIPTLDYLNSGLGPITWIMLKSDVPVRWFRQRMCTKSELLVGGIMGKPIKRWSNLWIVSDLDIM